MVENRPLFAKYDLAGAFRSSLDSLESKIQEIPRDEFLGSSDEDLLAYLRPKLEFVPLALRKTEKVMEEEEIKVEIEDYGRVTTVAGIRIVASIPYSGEFLLWNLRPSCSRSSCPEGEVTMRNGGGELKVLVEEPIARGGERIAALLNRNIEEIEWYIEKQRRDIESHNSTIDEAIRRAAERRRGVINQYKDIVTILNIPLKRRSGEPSFVEVPLRRKLVRPLPQPPETGFRPEPGISDERFEHILSVVRHSGRTFEACAHTLRALQEDGLRDIILASLNTHYEGQATGETFRRRGKTDIRIESSERSAFVAECKIWHGQAELKRAVDQLLSYMTWRDCKSSVIVFNKENARFTDLRQKAEEALTSHDQFVERIEQKQAGEWRGRFCSREDSERRVTVHVFLFNLHIETTQNKELKQTAGAAA